jgi:hypothetical protein
MNDLLALFNLTFGEFVSLAVLAVLLVIAWIGLRLMLRLTANLFRIGCGVIFLIVLAIFLLYYAA